MHDLYYTALFADCLGILIGLLIWCIPRFRLRWSGSAPLHQSLGVFAVWLAISFGLYKTGHEWLGIIIVCMPATVILGYGLMVLLMVIFKPRI